MTTIDSENFTNWFKGSKAGAADGQPLRLYRGSANSQRGRYEIAYYTADRRLAEIYAADRCAGTTDSAKVVVAHLSLKHPAGDKQVLAIAEKQGIRLSDRRFPAGGLESNTALVKALTEAGHDGVIGTDGDMESPPRLVTVYVAFYREQVRVIAEHVTPSLFADQRKG
jgi:hypothetical protein